MPVDGEIDYSSCSSAALDEALLRIEAEKYPLNHARLLAEIARRKADQALNSAVATPAARQRFEFRADPKEYFKIWIVNLALSIVTIGIYSAWAKVRKLRYFYSNTSLAGSSFGYHGDPIKILKGRIIAAVIAGAYFIAGRTSAIATLCIALFVALVTPWLVVKSRVFAMRVTSWRGIRFNFSSDYRGAYRSLLGWMVAGIVSVGILIPRFQRERYRFIVSRTHFGTADFSCQPPIGTFYWTALGVIVLSVVVMFATGFGAAFLVSPTLKLLGTAIDKNMAAKILGFLMVFVTYAVWFPVILGYTHARYLNTVINHTQVGPHRLHASLSARKLVGIYFTNLVCMIVTLGLYTPWAQIRLARYRLGAMEVEPHGSLDDITSLGPTSIPTATGEEISSFLDVDFGF